MTMRCRLGVTASLMISCDSAKHPSPLKQTSLLTPNPPVPIRQCRTRYRSHVHAVAADVMRGR